MRRRIIRGLGVEMSSGNVFADLGLRDAEKLRIKSGLVIQIVKAVRRLVARRGGSAQGIAATQGIEPISRRLPNDLAR